MSKPKGDNGLLGRLGYLSYIKGLNPALWFRLNELAGAVALNSGSLGHTYDGTYTACTLAQQGAMSATGAVLLDGATSKIDIPAGVYGNYSAYSLAALVKVNSTGEGGLGEFFSISTTMQFRFNTALTDIYATRNTGFGTADTSAGISAAQWTWLFLTYNNAGDRKQHIYKGGAGGVVELPYATQNAMTGAMPDLSATAATIGNLGAQTRTMDGLFDECLLFPAILSPVQMAQIVRLTGV